jgi:hypothetical protein
VLFLFKNSESQLLIPIKSNNGLKKEINLSLNEFKDSDDETSKSSERVYLIYILYINIYKYI